jgi:L-amino acid N-acyltransferase YncA
MNDPRLQNFAEAYLAMAGEARYRPQAPGDGMGNVCLSTEEAANPERLAREAGTYAIAFGKEDDALSFWIGCSDFETARAFVWAIEAARQLASGVEGRGVAAKLLEMALTQLTRLTKLTL